MAKSTAAPKTNIFAAAKSKAPATTGSKKDYRVVNVPGMEESLIQYQNLKAQQADIEAQLKMTHNEITNVAKDKFVEVYQSTGKNPDTFLIKDGDGCIMVMPKDAYAKIPDEARANQIEATYGPNSVVRSERFYFNPDVLERNMDAINKIISNSKEISQEDKENLLLPEITFSVAKGFIDKMPLNNLKTAIDDVKVQFSIRECGGAGMEDGGTVGEDVLSLGGFIIEPPVFKGWSDCCEAPVYGESDLCSHCGEHCIVLTEEELDMEMIRAERRADWNREHREDVGERRGRRQGNEEDVWEDGGEIGGERFISFLSHKEARSRYAKGGTAGHYNRGLSWHQDRAKHNKGEPWENRE